MIIVSKEVHKDRVVKVIKLEKGEHINDPSSTRRKIYGPKVVKQTIWVDGGIDTEVSDDCA